MSRPSLLIAQLSDIHCGSSYFDERLMTEAVEEIAGVRPDLVVVGGDLTAEGYAQEFVQARTFLEPLFVFPHVVIPGNHDSKNVGYVHFRDIFGTEGASEKGDVTVHLQMAEGAEAKPVTVVAVDSSKPDLNEGEVGRERYDWIRRQFSLPHDFRVFCLHHHLVPVPGTGRERNTVWDAGDVLSLLVELGVDMALSGHKHVPHVWVLSGVLLVCSGTVSTYRVRGYTRPSYNIIEVTPEMIRVTLRYPGEGESMMGELDRRSMRLTTSTDLEAMFHRSAWRP